MTPREVGLFVLAPGMERCPGTGPRYNEQGSKGICLFLERLELLKIFCIAVFCFHEHGTVPDDLSESREKRPGSLLRLGSRARQACYESCPPAGGDDPPLTHYYSSRYSSPPAGREGFCTRNVHTPLLGLPLVQLWM